jgi:hypothetical protein
VNRQKVARAFQPLLLLPNYCFAAGVHGVNGFLLNVWIVLVLHVIGVAAAMYFFRWFSFWVHALIVFFLLLAFNYAMTLTIVRNLSVNLSTTAIFYVVTLIVPCALSLGLSWFVFGAAKKNGLQK